MKTDTTQLANMGRRRFVKALSAFGLSGASLTHLSQEALASQSGNLTDEVPYVAYLACNNPDAVSADRGSDGRAPIYEKIPYDEWVTREAVHNAASNIARKIENAWDTDAVSATVTGTTSGGHRKLAVEVTRWTTEQHDGQVVEPDVTRDQVLEKVPDAAKAKVGSSRNPEVVDDIKVIHSEKTQTQQAYFNTKYRPVPAGCQMRHGGFASGNGTLGTPAYASDLGQTGMVTAGHVFNNTGDRAHQPKEPLGGGNRIGECHEMEVRNKFDAAIIDLDSSIGYNYDIANQADIGGTEGWPIDGIVTWQTLKSKVDTGYLLNLQGRTTGRNDGALIDTDTGAGSNEKRIMIDVDSDGGDSGGPHFRRISDSFSNDWTYIAGIHGWGSGTTAIGTAMEAVEDEMSVSIQSA